MAGIGYDRPDSRKQRTQSDKQHGARAPIRCVSRFDTVSNHETECVDQDMRTARSLVCAVAPVAPPAEPAQQNPTPRPSDRCRRIECSSYDPFDSDQRSFKTDVNFSNTL
jgi:hypothetical protein